MKTLARHLLAAALLLTAPALRAGNVISTLGNTQDNFASIPTGFTQLARAFTTSSTVSQLASITVQITNESSSNTARVQLYTSSNTSTVPETLVEDLGTITVTNGAFTNQTINSTLNPLLTANTRYWVSVSAGPSSPGSFKWGNATGTTVTSDIGSSLVDARASSTDGGATWSVVPGTKTQLFSVTSSNQRVVTITDDSGTGSLRQALADAASAAGPDLITFAPSLSGKTINLTTSSATAPFKRAIEINDASGSVIIDATALPGGLIISDGSATDYSLFRVNAGSTVAFHGVTFLNGGGAGVARGGAIQNYGSLTCTRCSFVGNQANNPGGNASNGSNGGAIYSESATLSLTHCTFSGNQATGGSGSGNGGAIRADSGTVALTHCTLAGNSASNQGGGLLLAGSALTLTNTIVGGNTATTSGSNIQNEGSITQVGRNIVKGTISGSGSAPTGSGFIDDVNPLLAGLAYYGGGTPTMPPIATSPAIDPFFGDSTSSFTTDQRGQPRVVGGIVDIGAVEYSAASTLSAVVTTTADSGLGSLRDTLAAVPSGSTITFDPTVFTGATAGTNTIHLTTSASFAAFTLLDNDVTIDATGIPGGVTLDGGSQGFRFFTVYNAASLTLRDLTLANGGGASFYFGGAIDNRGTLTLTRCTLSGNQANNSGGGTGGAIYNNGTATLTRCTLSGNSAYNNGGAILNFNPGSLTLTQCTLTGNTATHDYGGGICNDAGRTTLTHCTISGNTAPAGQGSGVASLGNANTHTTVENCIISGNTNSSVDVPAFTGTVNSFTSNGHNLIGSGNATAAFNASGDLINDAPGLLPLGNYGGPTQTMPPMAGSPAIDATSETSITDQRGFSAQDGDANASVLADIGAAEAQVLLVTTATDEDNGNTAPANGTGTSLREAIADTSGHADIIRFSPAVFDGQPAAIIRLSFNGSNSQLNITRNLSVDARNLPSGVTISGDANNSGTVNSGDTRIFTIYSDHTVALHGLTLKDGKAGGSGGGGIYNTTNATLTVNQCTLTGNHADVTNGGGGITNEGMLTVSLSTLTSNHADNAPFGGGGGGIRNTGTLTLNQSTLTGNHADNSGFGGGGICNFGTLSVNQSTLSGNHADNSNGGGIINNSGITTLTHCTVSGNTATANKGSGVASAGNSSTQTVVQNSIISGNGGSSVDYVVGGTNSFVSQGRNLIGSGNATGAFTGTNIINDTPLLAALASNGGPTQTMALRPTSPALNAALSSTATTDQRGFPIVGIADLGATEVQGSSVTLTSSDNPGIAGQSLTFTATVNESDPRTITPTGTVTFTVDNVPGSPVALNSSGIATLTTNALTSGTHDISATYNGDANLLTSTSSTLNQTVLDLTVGNTNDSGNGSLRQALANAALHPGPDTITLTITQTLTLTSELLINDSSGAVTIDASGLSGGYRLTDTGNVNYRLLHVQSGSTVIVKGLKFNNGGGSSFTGNGAAILNEGTLTMDTCTVNGGETQAGGGGLYAATGSTTTVDRSTFSSNTADTGGGGGLCTAANSTLTLNRCTLTNNNSPSGGGLRVLGSLTMTQCTLASNFAHTGAGLLTEAGSSATLVHCTVAGGYASISCSGVLARGTLSLQHCILGQNSGAEVPPVDLKVESGTTTLKGVNVIEKSTGTVAGVAAVSAKPLLNSLSNYGGPTQTMPPQPGSPALDQASVLSPALTTDQRGSPRPLGLRPDLGAVEGTVIVVTTPIDELDAPGALGNGVSLREAVRDVEAGGIIAFDRAVFNSTTTNTITLTKGPLNPQRNCTLNGSLNPGGITIIHTPTITAQPLPLSVASGAAANFAITVTNLSGGVAYQWRKDGSDMGGQTSAALALANVQQSDESFYDVRLSEAASPGALTLNNVVLNAFAATSQPASLIVDGAPVYIQRGPISAMLALGSTYTLNVVAIGPATPALTYQWIKAGKAISGATKSSYTITNAQLSNAGAYNCVVKSGTVLPGVASTTAEIGVVDTKPKVVNLKAGGSTTISVSAAGNGLQPFAWRRDSTTLAFITSSFPIKPAAIGDAGLYTCTVSGVAGSITTGCNTLLNVSSAAPAMVTPLALPPAFIGQAYYYQLPVVSFPGAPTTSFSRTGSLPTGMGFDSTTGVLSGRPTTTQTGGYALSFKAINAFASSAAATATLTVNVVPATAVGDFVGPADRSSLNDNLGGRFDLTTSANGTFSGSITLGARAKISFTNQLLLSAGSGDVILRGNLTGIAMADKTPLIAYVEVFASDQRATLTLVHPNGTTLVIPAWRKPWLISKTPALNNPATAYAAYYTGKLDVGTASNAPQGYGYTNFTVKTDGMLTLAGKLPDGSAISGGTFVSEDGEIALFNLLYANRGSHVGTLVITPSAPVTNNTLAGSTTWLKNATPATVTDYVYKGGFNALSVTTQGGVYIAPGKGAIVPGFTAVAAGGTNAKLSFSKGGLDTASPSSLEFEQLLRIYNPSASGTTNNTTIGTPLNNTTKLTTFTASSGLFVGNFTINGVTTALNRNAPFEGQLVKIGASTQGYGFFLLPTATAKISTSPMLSGKVVLGLP